MNMQCWDQNFSMHSLSRGIFEMAAPEKILRSERLEFPYLNFQLSEIYKIYF